MSQNPRDTALEQYFASMKRLCDNTDFQVYVAELTEQATNVNAVEDVAPSEHRTAEQELFFRKGQMNVIRTTQNLLNNIGICEGDYLKSLESDEDNSDEAESL